MANNYTLGRGEVHFAKFATGTQNPRGERYLGNTPEFGLTVEAEELEHFSSDRGIREKDDSVPLETTRTGSLTCDNIDKENLALFFFGSTSQVDNATPDTITGAAIEAVQVGHSYQLGMSDAYPAGARNVSGVVVRDGDNPTVEYVVGDDYTVDATLGRITIVEGGDIEDESDLEVDFVIAASSQVQIVSGSTPVEGALRFIAYNPKGEQFDYYFPWVKITPNGDFALKGEEWATIPFNIEVLKKSNREAIYVNGRPFAYSA